MVNWSSYFVPAVQLVAKGLTFLFGPMSLSASYLAIVVAIGETTFLVDKIFSVLAFIKRLIVCLLTIFIGHVADVLLSSSRDKYRDEVIMAIILTLFLTDIFPFLVRKNFPLAADLATVIKGILGKTGSKDDT